MFLKNNSGLICVEHRLLNHKYHKYTRTYFDSRLIKYVLRRIDHNVLSPSY